MKLVEEGVGEARDSYGQLFPDGRERRTWSERDPGSREDVWGWKGLNIGEELICVNFTFLRTFPLFEEGDGWFLVLQDRKPFGSGCTSA